MSQLKLSVGTVLFGCVCMIESIMPVCLAQGNQNDSPTKSADLVGIEYMSAIQEMDRFVCRLQGNYERCGTDSQTYIEVLDHIACRKAGKRLEDLVRRIERVSTVHFFEDEDRNEDERGFTCHKHDYIERYGDIIDVFGKNMQEDPWTPVNFFEPIVFPYLNTAAIMDGVGRVDQRVIDELLDEEETIDVVDVGNGLSIATFLSTDKKDRIHNYLRFVTFDENQGKMPILMRSRFPRKEEGIDRDDLIKSSALYSETKTKWAQSEKGK
jgi:hypothetical protein